MQTASSLILLATIPLERGWADGDVRFTADGSHLYTGDGAGTARVWNSATGCLLFEYPAAELSAKLFSGISAGHKAPGLEHNRSNLLSDLQVRHNYASRLRMPQWSYRFATPDSFDNTKLLARLPRGRRFRQFRPMPGPVGDFVFLASDDGVGFVLQTPHEERSSRVLLECAASTASFNDMETRIAIQDRAGNLTLWRLGPNGIDQPFRVNGCVTASTFLSGEDEIVLGRPDGTVELRSGAQWAISSRSDVLKESVREIIATRNGQLIVGAETSTALFSYTSMSRAPAIFEGRLEHVARDGRFLALTSAEAVTLVDVGRSEAAWTISKRYARVRISGDNTLVWCQNNDGRTDCFDAVAGYPLDGVFPSAPSQMKGEIEPLVDCGVVLRERPSASFPDPSRAFGYLGEGRNSSPSRHHLCWNALDPRASSQLAGFEPVVSDDGAQVACDQESVISLFGAEGRSVRLSFPGHSSRLKMAAFSPDGTRIVTASEDNTARVWNAQTGQELACLSGHGRSVNTAMFSRDGARVVTASDDNTARVWDSHTGQEHMCLVGHLNKLTSASFSPDGALIVTASDTSSSKFVGGVRVDEIPCRIWDAHTGQEIKQLAGHTKQVNAASFNPDGTRIVTASDDGTGRVWDAHTGQEIARLAGHEKQVKSSWLGVNAASFSSDGTCIVTASDDGTARVWDAATSQEIARLGVVKVWDAASEREKFSQIGHDGWVETAAFTDDGQLVITTARYDNAARVWDARTGEQLAILSGHSQPVRAASFIRDGARALTASDDNTARLWDSRSGQEIACLAGHRGKLTSASVSPDGMRIVTTSDDRTARVWDAATGQFISELGARVGSASGGADIAFSPDGLRVVAATTNGRVSCWLSDGKLLWSLEAQDVAPSTPLMIDQSGQVALVVDYRLRILDYTKKTSVLLQTDIKSVSQAILSPSGSRVLTINVDGSAELWDCTSGEQISGPHTGSRAMLASFSQMGDQVITAHEDGSIRVWDTASGAHSAPVGNGRKPISTCAFSKISDRILIAREDVVEVWSSSVAIQDPVSIPRDCPQEFSIDGWPVRFIHDVASLLHMPAEKLLQLAMPDVAANSIRLMKAGRPQTASSFLHVPVGELRTAFDRLAALGAVWKRQGKLLDIPTYQERSQAIGSHGQAAWMAEFKIEAFTSSVHFGRVRGLLLAPPFRMGEDAATLLARLLAPAGHLLSGHRASIAVANLAALDLDKKLHQLAMTHSATVARHNSTVFFSSTVAAPLPGLFTLHQGEAGDRVPVATRSLVKAVAKAGFRLVPSGTLHVEIQKFDQVA